MEFEQWFQGWYYQFVQVHHRVEEMTIVPYYEMKREDFPGFRTERKLVMEKLEAVRWACDTEDGPELLSAWKSYREELVNHLTQKEKTW